MKTVIEQHKFQFVMAANVHHTTVCGGGININDDYHIMHITKGTAKITIHKTTYTVTRGSVVAIPPFVQFVWAFEPDFKMKNIHFRLWSADDEPIERQWILPFVFTPDYFEHTESLLDELCSLDYKNPRNHARYTAIAHEITLDHWLRVKAHRSQPEIIDHRIEKLHDILISPECRHYDAKMLARTCSLSVSQMNRLFKRTFKCAPQKVWEERRLAEICIALDTRLNLTIGEIATEFGFDEPAYFSRWFKQRAKCSPATFRKELANNPAH